MRQLLIVDSSAGDEAGPPSVRAWSEPGGSGAGPVVVQGIGGNGVMDPRGVAARVAGAARAGGAGGVLVACWAGWVESEDEGEGASPRTWGPAGWAGLERCCREIGDVVVPSGCAARTRVCFWTRAGTVLSDIPSSQRFLAIARAWAESGGPGAEGAEGAGGAGGAGEGIGGSEARKGVQFGLIVDPIRMLTADMRAHADEHVERIISSLGGLEGVAAVVVSDVGTADGRGVLNVLSLPRLGALLRERLGSDAAIGVESRAPESLRRELGW